jgi:isoleucyl-tRNA synthetase
LKISKSKGNAKSLDELLAENGTDILRLWALSCDFTHDMRIGDEILTRVKDVYRRIRNIMRYLIGATYDIKEHEVVEYSDLVNLEKYVLHKLNQTNSEILSAFEKCDFKDAINSMHNFCVDISADYLDLRKDSLYCDSVDSINRKSSRSVMKIIASYLIRLVAPILSITADEAWKYFNAGLVGDDSTGEDLFQKYSSVHEENLPEFESNWVCDSIKDKFDKLFEFKKIVNIEIEKARNESKIQGGLSCALNLSLNDELYSILTSDIGISPEDFFCVSQISISSMSEGSYSVKVESANGTKCDRCWKIVQNVTTDENGSVCDRCKSAI